VVGNEGENVLLTFEFLNKLWKLLVKTTPRNIVIPCPQNKTKKKLLTEIIVLEKWLLRDTIA
jgi:hypothetical protein